MAESTLLKAYGVSRFKNRSSIYPLNPVGSKSVIRVSGDALTNYDRLVVGMSSLFFVGGVFWVPAVYAWLISRFRRIPTDQKRRRAICAALIFSLTTLYAIGPHRNPKMGERVKVHKWGLWKSWMRFFAFEVVADEYDSIKDLVHEQAILGISPHGIFPFGLAFAALSEQAAQAFGSFRAVVASATQLLPWVRDVLRWVNACDASKSSVDKALLNGDRLGLAPGGIAEILQDPDPEHEYAIIGRGIFRMAAKHRLPIVPVYCFGSSMLLKRLKLPYFVEKLSLMLRMSLVLFFGQWGLPIPFRQRLLYVMGRPIYPQFPDDVGGMTTMNSSNSDIVNQAAELMYQQYGQELIRIFDRHKESYAAGW
eukprot:CAMPEP_0116088820 /NCGR_PEP_ID=MMETSP0327-20121206/6077_1 /TAXON_ID=44447 /ORGANISM="Pseudo-nitzschia delicatissima, Strain B596" /LENGTH=365 /DNA_ID=CAMNT_0003579933 /DNA_START=130 /DNA_END=1224 /DNA_ORIENTATION=+